MKWIIGGLTAIVLAVTGTVVNAGAAANDFRFESFHAEYYLDADSEGRSTLKTVETLVAQFPDRDQNHGIERALPKSYDGHPTSLKVVSVTDGAGKKMPYTTSSKNGNKVLRIGDADKYVRGEQTYVITYTQRDVTKYFADVPDHEFYWDVNGTQWRQSFGQVSAAVHIADKLLPTLTDNISCYHGVEGSTERCPVNEKDGVVTARADNLRPGENMTLAVGFTAGTFRGYEPSLWDRILAAWIVVLVVSSIVAVAILVWLITRYSRASNRSRELNPIPTEYIPPKDTSVLLSAKVADGARADATAQLIDLAVRNFITITQTRNKSTWKQAEYDLEIVKSVIDLSQEERQFVRTMFGSEAPGTKLATKTLSNNYKLSSALQKNTQELTKLVKGNYALRREDKEVTRSFKRIGIIVGVISVLMVSPLLFVVAVTAYGCGMAIRPLTDKGLELRRYLAGLKSYIELAEKDRIKALQSPEAVAKTGVTIKGDTDKKLIKLYEKTLPYAILFGQEKEWHKQLAVHYEENDMSPSWYAGHGAFNAAVFTSAMNSFSSSMNSYGASSSSSSGGSSGGGSSGGGGGGGGGGGW